MTNDEARTAYVLELLDDIKDMIIARRGVLKINKYRYIPIADKDRSGSVAQAIGDEIQDSLLTAIIVLGGEFIPKHGPYRTDSDLFWDFMTGGAIEAIEGNRYQE